MAERLFRDGADGAPNVVNMPAGESFLPLLASGLREALGQRLNKALILLPTRRAVRELGEAFVATAPDGGSAARLPLMRPLADVDPEEPPFEPGDLAHMITLAIDPVHRRFELARLVLAKEAKLRDIAPDAAAALALTDPLLSLLDDAAMEELDVTKLDALDDYFGTTSAHFEQAAIFYKIVQRFWPEYLADNHLMDPMARRVTLLRELAAQWEAEPPGYPVIIAGSTGTLDATANLMRVVSRLPEGLIVLPGLDLHMPEVWDKIDETHPLGSLKRAIGVIGVERDDVRQFPGRRSGAAPIARRRLIGEALIPADSTSDWLDRIALLSAQPDNPFDAGLEGLSLIETRTPYEEASVVALIMREVLDTPGKTAALVTPDPSLGRRVKARLTRWGVRVDVSAGEPLEETSAGSFLSLILALCHDPWDAVSLAALFKHPKFAFGKRPNAAARLWREMEPHVFRGACPTSLEGIKRKIDKTNARRKGKLDLGAHIDLLTRVQATLHPLSASADEPRGHSERARALCEIAAELAATDADTGAQMLWRGEDGDAAAKLCTDMLSHGQRLPGGDLETFTRLLTNLMRGRVVRPRFGTHPRLQILGPLEARMIRADKLILGGLNEGVWPAAPQIDPLLPRHMRQELGLSSPERRFGLSAHDFAQLAAHPDVTLTRAARDNDAPVVASRWLWRLKTLIRGALYASEPDGNIAEDKVLERLAPDTDYLAIARAVDHVDASDVMPAQPPAPRPKVKDRPRRLSVTRIETWLRDPYAIYAANILKLDALDALGEGPGPREYGNAIHAAVEIFSHHFAKAVPDKAVSWLTERFEEELLAGGFAPEEMAFERANLKQLAIWFVDWERGRRDDGYRTVGIEQKGALKIPTSEGDFTLSGIADRIDTGPDGLSILDYKTGMPSGAGEVNIGIAPQLALLGYMAQSGAFGETMEREVSELGYVRLSGRNAFARTAQGEPGGRNKAYRETPDLIAQAAEGLRKRIADFDDPNMPYMSNPLPKFENKYADYDHLARRAEWASTGEGGDDE
ncbi:double-strand break repair protein AddB [Robiginitomaculum antarcticum]|uniref:double-strand break repair protein AddB n=1 Tax=Robiginitomaculum antarcticum TaxID=437507 RepID=UPI000360605A|nr:double-strand break repair protein AddB [Robiginitomaculum antarcticum]